MSIGSFGGVLGSSAGTSLPQSQAGQQREATDAAAVDRRIHQDRKADAAAGVGETAEDAESGDRDADGRRLWEQPGEKPEEPEQVGEASTRPKQSKDASGAAGNSLDLTG